MGARGKKRRRADGSIAGKPGRGRFNFGGAPAFEAVEAMPAHVLEEAAQICWGYMPLDGSEISDWDVEDECEEISALAALHGVDSERLGVRAEKLVNLLRSPQGHGLYTLDGNRLHVDEALLEFAATAKADNSNSPLLLPVRSDTPER